jgi:LuxR family maltose regulon positive regulatory protein
VEVTRALAWLAAGELENARQWAAAVPPDDRYPLRGEWARITAARVRLALGDPQTALQDLTALAREAADRGWRGRLVEIDALRAAALHACGEEDNALAALAQALETAAAQGYARTIIEADRTMPGILARGIRREAWAAPLLDYAKRLAQLAGHPEGPPNAPTLVEALSAREHEVLRLIDEGLSNKEIAARLVLSTGTVRVHTASIYRKLDVESRTQALAKARILRFI